MDWFYDKIITITTNTSVYDAETGLFDNAENVTLTIPCDIQPLDTKIDVDNLGKLIDAEYKIYCDPNNNINTKCNVTYKGNDYNLVKITDWDDYYILYIKAVT